MKILVVDDEELIRSVIREYAELDGYTVDEAANGQEAIEKCETNNYDLIVMDIMMPKVDGYQSIKKIKETKNIPVLMLSARGPSFWLYGIFVTR